MKEIMVLIDGGENEVDTKAVNLTAIEDDVRHAFHKQFPRQESNVESESWIVETWDEYVIASKAGDHYRVPYVWKDSKDITFVPINQWQPVEKVWVSAMRAAKEYESVVVSVGLKKKWTRAMINRLPDSAFLFVEKGGEKDEEGKTVPRSLRHLPVRDQAGNIDLPHLRNALSRLGQPITGKVEGASKWLTEDLRKKLIAKARRMLEEEQKALSDSERVQSNAENDKQIDACECKSCGHRVEHEKGTPCSETACSKCGEKMMGVMDAEITTAVGEAGRTVIASDAGQIEAQVKQDGDNSIGQRLVKEFEGLKNALLELVGLKSSQDNEQDIIDIPVEPAIALKAMDTAIQHGSSLISFKGYDGRDWLLTFTTNAFIDREEEIFTTKSIEDYVTRHEDEDVKGEYQFWHLPGTKFGDVRWQGAVGRFLVEAGTYDDTEVGHAFKSFFERNPNGYPDLSPSGWGCSHKYEYKGEDRDDGVYDWFEKSETTILPLDVAANPYTAPLFISRSKTMNERQRKALELIGGKSLVEMVQEVGEKATAELERNVAYKAKADDYPAKLMEYANEMEDGEAKKGVQSIAKAMRGMPPWLKKPVEDEEEDEEEEEEKPKKKKKQVEEASAEAAAAPAETQVEASVEAATEETPAEDAATEETPAEDATTEETTTGTITEAPADEKEYRDAVAESFTSMVVHFNEQIAGLTTEIKQLKETVGQVARDDEAKIAEKAMLTPAASLLSTVQRAIGVKETRVDGRTAYAQDGPRMTPSDGGITPVPMLNMFMTNEDQKQAR